MNIFSANIYEAFSNMPSAKANSAIDTNNLAAMMMNPAKDLLNFNKLLF